jgi:hypothetical protein
MANVSHVITDITTLDHMHGFEVFEQEVLELTD